MPVSFSGLDLSWLNDPANRLPPRKVKRKRLPNKRSDLPSPYVMGDIGEFISNATPTPTLIGSRSQLRAYERDNGIKQCGDFKKGEIISAQKKRWQEATSISEADKKASDFKWVD